MWECGLEALVQEHQVQAVRTAYFVTRDRALAEDVVQAAFPFSTILYPQSHRLALRLAFPMGRTLGLPRSARVPAWVRSLLYTGGAPSAIDDA
jgi:hypothetical protein